ncbi:MAG: plasmid pRiA4b ORF-3 family protein [Pseudomonadota bacterium]
MKTKPSSVYQFKITLEEIKPIIWRRIQVPQRYNFWDLHVAIQDSMGWQDYHLHQFEMVNPKTGEKVHITIQDDDNEDLYDSPVIPDEEAKISSYFTLENKTAKYEYDFGDGWEHKIVLEKILPAEPGVKYPICTEGQRACPPEDCGGTYGYQELLEIVSDPKNEEYEFRKEWLGYVYNPGDFDPKSVRFDSPKKRWKIAFEHLYL